MTDITGTEEAQRYANIQGVFEYCENRSKATGQPIADIWEAVMMAAAAITVFKGSPSCLTTASDAQ
jgi:hypothetical protein